VCHALSDGRVARMTLVHCQEELEPAAEVGIAPQEWESRRRDPVAPAPIGAQGAD